MRHKTHTTAKIRPGTAPSKTAVFFDFVNTLAAFQDLSFEETARNLHQLLVEAGFTVSFSQFWQCYKEVIQSYIEIRRNEYKEISNLDFIVGTLKQLGIAVEKSDPKLSAIVNGYFVPFRESLRIFPRTWETLFTLKDDFGLKLGLISNFTNSRAIHDFLEDLDIKKFFDVIVVSCDVGVRKPHQLIFDTALNQMGTEPTESVFVGDDLECDIAGAKNMGIVTIQIETSMPPPIDQIAKDQPRDIPPCQPDYKINSIFEVVEIMRSLNQPLK